MTKAHKTSRVGMSVSRLRPKGYRSRFEPNVTCKVGVGGIDVREVHEDGPIIA